MAHLDRRALEIGTLWVPISNFLGLKTVRRIFNPAQSAGLKCPRVYYHARAIGLDPQSRA
jgi:hypothetical protein